MEDKRIEDRKGDGNEKPHYQVHQRKLSGKLIVVSTRLISEIKLSMPRYIQSAPQVFSSSTIPAQSIVSSLSSSASDIPDLSSAHSPSETKPAENSSMTLSVKPISASQFLTPPAESTSLPVKRALATSWPSILITEDTSTATTPQRSDSNSSLPSLDSSLSHSMEEEEDYIPTEPEEYHMDELIIKKRRSIIVKKNTFYPFNAKYQCDYREKCFRTNPNHFQKYSHPLTHPFVMNIKNKLSSNSNNNNDNYNPNHPNHPNHHHHHHYQQQQQQQVDEEESNRAKKEELILKEEREKKLKNKSNEYNSNSNIRSRRGSESRYSINKYPESDPEHINIPQKDMISSGYKNDNDININHDINRYKEPSDMIDNDSGLVLGYLKFDPVNMNYSIANNDIDPIDSLSIDQLKDIVRKISSKVDVKDIIGFQPVSQKQQQNDNDNDRKITVSSISISSSHYKDDSSIFNSNSSSRSDNNMDIIIIIIIITYHLHHHHHHQILVN